MFIWVCGKKREGRIVCIMVLDYWVAKQCAVIGEENVVRWIRHQHSHNPSSWQPSKFFLPPPHSFHPTFFSFGMVPLFFFIYIAFLLPPSLAGPACAKKHFKAADCVQKCKSRWGWPGVMMGNDPWGSVVKKADAGINWDSVISQACGSTMYVIF